MNASEDVRFVATTQTCRLFYFKMQRTVEYTQRSGCKDVALAHVWVITTRTLTLPTYFQSLQRIFRIRNVHADGELLVLRRTQCLDNITQEDQAVRSGVPDADQFSRNKSHESSRRAVVRGSVEGRTPRRQAASTREKAKRSNDNPTPNRSYECRRS